MKLFQAALATVVVGIAVKNVIAILLPMKMRIGNCGCGRGGVCPVIVDPGKETPADTFAVVQEGREVTKRFSNEVSGLLSDVDSVPNRSCVTEEDLSGEQVVMIEITVITTLIPKLDKIDVQDITQGDVNSIKEATEKVKIMRTELVSGSKVITCKDKAKILSAVKITANSMGGMNDVLEDMTRSKSLEARRKISLAMKLRVPNIFSDVTYLVDKNASIVVSNLSISGLVEIKTIFIDISTSGLAMLNQETLTSLSKHSSELQNVIRNFESGEIDSISFEDREILLNISAMKESVTTSISSAASKNAMTANIQMETRVYKAIIAATATVEDRISSIISSQHSSGVFDESITFEIHNEIFRAYGDIQKYFDSMMTHEEIMMVIPNLKKIDETAEKIIKSSQTTKVIVIRLKELVIANKNVQQTATRFMENSLFSSETMKKTEVFSLAHHYLKSIKESAKNIKNKQQSLSPIEPSINFTESVAYLSKLNVRRLSKEDNDKLRNFHILMQSNKANNVDPESLNDIIVVTSNVSEELSGGLESINNKERMVSTHQETENAVKSLRFMTLQLQNFVIMDSNVISGDGSDRQEIDGAFTKFTQNIIKYSSKSYVVRQDDFTESQNILSSLLGQVGGRFPGKKLKIERIMDLLKKATKSTIKKRKNIEKKMKNRKSLDILNLMKSTVDEVRMHVALLEKSSSASTSAASVVVFDIKKQLEVFSKNPNLVQVFQIDAVHQDLATLQILNSQGSKVSNSNELSSVTNDLLESIDKKIKEATNADKASEAESNVETAVNFTIKSSELLRDLIDLTISSEDENTTYPEVPNITNVIKKLISRNAHEISTKEIGEFRVALEALRLLVSNVKEGLTSFSKAGLSKALKKMEDAKKILQKSLKTERINKVKILKDIKMLINQTVVTLQKGMVNSNSPHNSRFDIIKSQSIDDFAVFLANIRKGSPAVSQEDLESLKLILKSVNKVTRVSNEFTILKGYKYTTENIFRYGSEVTGLLQEIILEEEDRADLDHSLSISLYLKETLGVMRSSLDLISNATDTDNTYSSQVNDFTVIMLNISQNLKSFDNRSVLLEMINTVYEIEEKNIKPNGIEELLNVSKSVHAKVTHLTKELSLEVSKRESIHRASAVSAKTEMMTREMDNAFENIDPEVLFGDPDEDIQRHTDDVQSLLLDVESITDEKLRELSQFTLSFFSDIKYRKGGNIIQYKIAMKKVGVAAKERREEQEDRQAVAREIQMKKNSTLVLEKIKLKISEIIGIMASSSISTYEPDIIVSNLLRDLSHIDSEPERSHIIEPYIKDLEILKEETVSGKGIKDIYLAQSHVDKLLEKSISEGQFLEAIRISREGIDSAKHSMKLLNMIIEEVNHIAKHYSEKLSETQAVSSSSRQTSFSYYISVLEGVKDGTLTHELQGKLQDIVNELEDFDFEKSVDVKELRDLQDVTKRGLHFVGSTLVEEQRLSSERKRETKLIKIGSLYEHADTILMKFVNNETTTEEGNATYYNLNIFLNYTLSLPSDFDMDNDMQESLKHMLDKLERSNVSLPEGETVKRIKMAKDHIKNLKMSLKQERSSFKKVTKRTAITAAKGRLRNVFKRIIKKVSKLSSSTGTATETKKDSAVSSIILYLQSTSLEDNSNVEQLENLLEALEAVKENKSVRIENSVMLSSMCKSRIRKEDRAISTLSKTNKKMASEKKHKRHRTSILELEKDLDSFTVTDNEESTNKKIEKELLESLDVVTSGAETDEDSLTELREKQKMIKGKLRISKNFYRSMKNHIQKAVTKIDKKLRESKSQSRRLAQFDKLLEYNKKVKIVKELMVKINSKEETQQEFPKNKTVIDEIILLFKQTFEVSNPYISEISDDLLNSVHKKIPEIYKILNKGIKIKGSSKLHKLCLSIMDSITTENQGIEEENNQDTEKEQKEERERILEKATSILQVIVNQTRLSSVEHPEAIRIPEIDRVRHLVTHIAGGDAEDDDSNTEMLKLSIKDLQSSLAFLTNIRIYKLEDTVQMVKRLHGSTKRGLTETRFEISYSTKIMEEKRKKSVVSDTVSVLENLGRLEGNGSGGTFNNSVIIDIMVIAERMETKNSPSLAAQLEENIKILKNVTTDLPKNTKIVGIKGTKITDIKKITQRIKSVRESIVSSISQSYMIGKKSKELSEARHEALYLSKIRDALVKMYKREPTAPQDSSSKILVIDEILQFMKEDNAKDIYALKDYYRILGQMNEETLDRKRVKELLISVDNRERSIQYSLSTKERKHRQVKHSLFMNDAKGKMKDFLSFRKRDRSKPVELNDAVTKASHSLRNMNMLTIDAFKISEIEAEMENFAGAISSSNAENIAFEESFLDQLVSAYHLADNYLLIERNTRKKEKELLYLTKSRSAFNDTYFKLKSIKSNSTFSKDTNLIENNPMTKLFDFLTLHMNDFRLLNEEFREQLAEYTGDVMLSSDVANAYNFEETLELLKHFLSAGEKIKKSVKHSKSIEEFKEIQRTIITFENELEQTIFSDQSLETEQEVEDESTESTISTAGMTTSSEEIHESFNNTDSLNKTTTSATTEPSSFTSAGMNATLEESPDGTVQDEIIRQIEESNDASIVIESTVMALNELSLSTGIEKHHLSKIADLMSKLSRMDMKLITFKYSKSYLLKLFSKVQYASLNIGALVRNKESNTQVKNSFDMFEELIEMLQSIKRSIMKISKTKKGSDDTRFILISIMEIITRFNSVHFITLQDVSSLRLYALRLKSASKSSDFFEYDFNKIKSHLTSKILIVQSAMSSLSSFIKVSELTRESSTPYDSSSSNAEKFSITISSTFSNRNGYDKNEMTIIESMNHISQYSFVLAEFQGLAELTSNIVSAVIIQNSINESTSTSSTEYSSDQQDQDMDTNNTSMESSANTPGNESTISDEDPTNETLSDNSTDSGDNTEEDVEHGNEDFDSENGDDILNQMMIMLKASFLNPEGVNLNTLTSFASFTKDMELLLDSSIVFEMSKIEQLQTIISTAKTTFNRTMTSMFGYFTESKRFMNLQQASNAMKELRQKFDEHDSEDGINNSDEGLNNVTDGSSSTEGPSTTTTDEPNSSTGSHNITTDEHDLVLKHLDTITKVTMEFKLGRNSIEDEALYTFRESSKHVEEYIKSHKVDVSQYILIKFFVSQSETTETYLQTQSLNKHILVSAKSQMDFALNKRALECTKQLDFELINISTVFDEVNGSLSVSLGRFKKIVKDISSISLKFIKGEVETHDVITCEKYITEMSDLSLSLEGSKPIPEIKRIMKRLEYSIIILDTSLERINGDIAENENDVDLYTKQDMCFQMNYILKDEHLYKNSNVTDIGDIELVKTSGHEIDVINRLYNVFYKNSSSITSIDTEELRGYFRELLIALGNKTDFRKVLHFSDIHIAIQDSGKDLTTKLRRGTYERASKTAAKMLSITTKALMSRDNKKFSKLLYTEEVCLTYKLVRLLLSKFSLITLTDIREFAIKGNELQYAIKYYGSNLACLFQIDENLAYMQYAAFENAQQILKGYKAERAFTILSKASKSIDYAKDKINSLLTSKVELTSGELEHSIAKGQFQYFIDMTSKLPLNFYAKVRSYNFSSFDLSSSSQISYLRQILHRFKMMENNLNILRVTSKFQQGLKISKRISEALTQIHKKLKHSVDSESDAQNNEANSSEENKVNSTESSVTDSFESSSQSSTAEIEQTTLLSESSTADGSNYTNSTEDPSSLNSGTNTKDSHTESITVNSVKERILDLLRLLIRNNLHLEKDAVNDLEYYTKIMTSLSFSQIKEISNLSNFVNRLLHISTYMKLLGHSYESAIQYSISLRHTTEVLEIIKILRQAIAQLEDGLVPEEMKSHFDAILHIFKGKFAVDFTLISDKNLASCRKHAYQISANNIFDYDNVNTSMNSSDILVILSNVEIKINEVHHLFSIYYYQYKRILLNVNRAYTSLDIIQSLRHIFSSQLLFTTAITDKMLIKAYHLLQNFSGEMKLDDNSPIHKAMNDLLVILKVLQPQNRGKLKHVYAISGVLRNLESSAEEETSDVNNQKNSSSSEEGETDSTASQNSKEFSSSTENQLLEAENSSSSEEGGTDNTASIDDANTTSSAENQSLETENSSSSENVGCDKNAFKGLNDKSYLDYAIELIKSRKISFAITDEIIGDYSRTSTTVLILQSSATLIEQATKEARQWIYGDSVMDGTNIDSPTDSSLNTSSTSESQDSSTDASIIASTIAADNQSVVTTIHSTTIGLASSTSSSNDNNSSEALSTTSPFTTVNSNSTITDTPNNYSVIDNLTTSNNYNAGGKTFTKFQNYFNHISDILMYWLYDVSSVDIQSITDVRNFFKVIEHNCQSASGLQEWDQMLINSRVPLSSVIQMYLNQTLNKAKVERKISMLKYTKNIVTKFAKELVKSRIISQSEEMSKDKSSQESEEGSYGSEDNSSQESEEGSHGSEDNPSQESEEGSYGSEDTSSQESEESSYGSEDKSSQDSEEGSYGSEDKSSQESEEGSYGSEEMSQETASSSGDSFEYEYDPQANAKRQREDSIETVNFKTRHLITLSLRLLTGMITSHNKDISYSEIFELKSYLQEISYLLKAGGNATESFKDIQSSLLECKTELDLVIKNLTAYEKKSSLVREASFDYSFVMQVRLMIKYYISLIKVIIDNGQSPTNDANATSTTFVASSSTSGAPTGSDSANTDSSSSVTSSTLGVVSTESNTNIDVSSTTIDENSTNMINRSEDIITLSEELLEAVKKEFRDEKYENNSTMPANSNASTNGANITFTTESASTIDAVMGSTTSETNETSGHLTSTEATDPGENNTCPESSDENVTCALCNKTTVTFKKDDQFVGYPYLRDVVYKFVKAMRNPNDATHAVLNNLYDTEAILVKYIDSLEKHNMTDNEGIHDLVMSNDDYKFLDIENSE